MIRKGLLLLFCAVLLGVLGVEFLEKEGMRRCHHWHLVRYLWPGRFEESGGPIVGVCVFCAGGGSIFLLRFEGRGRDGGGAQCTIRIEREGGYIVCTTAVFGCIERQLLIFCLRLS